MKISDNGLAFIKQFEGLRLTAYLDSVNVPTIGWGTTMYPNGKKVKIGDTITSAQAEEYLRTDVNRRGAAMGNIKGLNQNQTDALISWCYNCGLGAWNKSTLRKKVLANPNDPTISDEFKKWNKGNGKILPGLTARRKKESDLYFS
jgi:lysozyme